MQILSKKRFEFTGDGVKPFITAGGGTIQSAPDWIEKHPLFDLAVAEGSLYVMQDKKKTSSRKKEKNTEETEEHAETATNAAEE